MTYFLDLLNYLTYVGGHKVTFLGFRFGLDKIFHISMILILGFIFNILLTIILKDKYKIKLIIIFILLLIISFGKELLDLYIRHTVFSLYDIYADFIGIIIFYLILFFFNFIVKRK